ncbi:hypothetical protein PR048_022934 [Dryococelus australis]|uniref:Integrase catalytic domain-containing protein n=1 Tax=Dryococelus australis TaxID=614101 RepID=A0ABQ9GSN9_9NEOP|nr:hypothetical protein PR048_022934 [Dryococelus australis]
MDGNEMIFKAVSGGSDVYLTSLPAVCDTSSSYRDCDMRLKGKIKSTGFTDSVSRTSAVLNLVHSDVAGRITPPSIGGAAEYFVTFMDNYSRYSEVKALKKNLMLLKPSNNIKAGLKFFKKKIKSLQSDNGGENIVKEFKNHPRDKGILLRKTVLYSSQQNRKVERLNQTFNEHDKLWFDKDLTVDDIEHIYIYGCQMWEATLENGKLSSRAEECTFIRFQEGIKGYRLWKLSDKKIIVSRDVHVYEHVFPFKTPCPAKPLVREQENVVEIPAVEERNEDEKSEKLHSPDIRRGENVNQHIQREMAHDQIEVRVGQGDRSEHIESETLDRGETGQRRSTREGRRKQYIVVAHKRLIY